MTPEQFIVFVQRLSYKPNWAIETLDPFGGLAVILVVRFKAPDSTAPDHEVTVCLRKAVHPESIEHWKDDDASRFIQETIYDIELHEADEWLRLDGALVHDPHE